MKCPNCGAGDHRVLRTEQEEDIVTRLRECADCRARWHTAEAPTTVIERANDIVAAFQRMKEAIPGGE